MRGLGKKLAMLAISLWVITVVRAVPSFGHDENGKCEPAMHRGDPNKLPYATVIGSGRNEDVLPLYEEAFRFFFGPGGLLERFGLKISPQVARIVAGREMDLLASQGRHAVGHWSEGAGIVRQVSSNNGVIYEFVASQSDQCQVAYYRDTLAWDQQISIIMHVIGHDLFATHSKMVQKRKFNTVGRSLALYTLVENLYRSQNREEVSAWYDFLTMLSYFQDMSRGTYEPPATFAPGSGKKIPLHPTANVLQALVANLPPNTPSWKKEMAAQFEAIHRHYSGSAPTKIMNEGFATLMQELLPAHSPYSDLTHLFGWSDLSSGVVRGGYSNPYKLGLEAWRRVRARFNARPENKGLDRFAMDKAFLQHALHDVISVYDDYSFLSFALDLVWARESGLALTRELEPEQWQQIPPPRSRQFRQPTQRAVVSRDPDRLIRKLQRTVADLRIRLPRIVLKDLYFERRAILFGFEDEFGSNLPLEPSGLISALYMIAFHLERNAAVDTVVLVHSPTPHRVRLEVTPTGTVTVTALQKDLGDDIIRTLSSDYQELLKQFREYQDIGVENPAVKLVQSQSAFDGVVSEVAAGMANAVPPSLLMAAPTAARAVAEYHSVLSTRLAAALRLAMQGKSPLRRGPGGVSVDALPVIPSLSFDQQAMGIVFGSDDLRTAVKSVSTSVKRADDDQDLENADGDEGTIYWGEGRPKQGEGDGDGEPGDQPSEGNQPGQGSREPTGVTIPHDLYAKLLSTLIELPNLNPKHGPSQAWTKKRHGSAVGQHGELAMERIQENAYAIGRAKLLERGDIEKSNSPRECIVEGLKHLQDEDWRIVSRRPDVKPDISAMMVFVVDASGSMNEFKSTVKQIVYDLQAILSRKYARMEFRFVMFDGNTVVYKTLDAFLNAWKGGGTDYDAGFTSALKVQEEFPRALYDRYVTVIGDLDDFGSSEATLKKARQLVDQSEFVGTMYTSFGDGEIPGSDLGQTLRTWSDQEKFVGFVPVLGPNGYYPALLRKLFKNPD